MDAFNGRPGDRRGFVHKKLFGAVKGAVGSLVSGGNPITGAIGGFVGGGGARMAPAGVRSTSPLIVERLGIVGRGIQSASCGPGFFRDTAGRCVELVTRAETGFRARAERFFPGGATGRVEFGAAVMGQFGAALEPGVRASDVRVCPRGTVLGVDGLCYNKRDIKNSERWWPRGRRPLLTGGEMRAITIASRAATKLQAKQKQLVELGMLKSPVRRSKTKALPKGHHGHVAHD